MASTQHHQLYEATRQRYLNMCNEFGWHSINWNDYFSNPEMILPKGLISEIDDDDNTLVTIKKDVGEESSTRASIVHFKEEEQPQQGTIPIISIQDGHHHHQHHHHHHTAENEFNERVVISISDDDDESDEEMGNTSPTRRKSRKSFGKRIIEDKSDSEEEYDFEKDKENDEDDEDVIEKIIKKRVKNKQVEYYVKWEGYPSSENSWLKESDISNSDIIEEFEKEQRRSTVLSDDSDESEEEESEEESEEEFSFEDENDDEYSDEEYVDSEDDKDDEDVSASPEIKKKSKTAATTKGTKGNSKSNSSAVHDIIEIDDDDLHEKSILVVPDKKSGKSKAKQQPLTFQDMNAKQFKKVRDELLQKYYDEFNRVCFQNKLPTMKVSKEKAKDLKGKPYLLWNQHLRKTAGLCKMFTINRGQIKVCAIEISTKVCNSEERLVYTLAHEMCHAASFLFDNVTGHGKTFYLYGGIVQKYYPDVPITTCHSYDIDYKYQWKCVDCGTIVKRHSKSIDTTKDRCRVCTGELETIGKSNKQPSKYNIFMKENYKKLKDKNPHLDRKEIMKLVAQSYKESK